MERAGSREGGLQRGRTIGRGIMEREGQRTAQMEGTEVRLYSSTSTAPDGFSFTPTPCRPPAAVAAALSGGGGGAVAAVAAGSRKRSINNNNSRE